jgi:predicted nuclease of restriction endonuclease-like (RecB) superfamily
MGSDDTKMTIDGYGDLLTQMKQQIHGARMRAVLAANQALTLLYWDLGQTILERQAEEGWGAKVIDRLSRDLRRAFPDMKGLSPRNLKYMRRFAEAWPDLEVVQQAVARIPWGHNVRLLDKLDGPDLRLWYVRKTIEHGWSRNILMMQV